MPALTLMNYNFRCPPPGSETQKKPRQNRVNKDLKSVNTWLSSNKLTLNLTKTEFLVITSRQR